MQTSKTVWVALIAVAIIAIGGYFFPQVAAKLGSIQATTDISTSNFTTLASANGIANGGVFTTAARIAMTTGTSTPCAIQGPNATSSLLSVSWNIIVGTTTSITLDMGTSTTAFATSSAPFIKAKAGAGTPVTTWSAGSDNGVLGPSQWVVMGIRAASGSDATNAETGICTAVFQVLN